MSHAQLSILTRKRQARGVKGRLGHPLCRPLSLSLARRYFCRRRPGFKGRAGAESARACNGD